MNRESYGLLLSANELQLQLRRHATRRMLDGPERDDVAIPQVGDLRDPRVMDQKPCVVRDRRTLVVGGRAGIQALGDAIARPLDGDPRLAGGPAAVVRRPQDGILVPLGERVRVRGSNRSREAGHPISPPRTRVRVKDSRAATVAGARNADPARVVRVASGLDARDGRPGIANDRETDARLRRERDVSGVGSA